MGKLKISLTPTVSFIPIIIVGHLIGFLIKHSNSEYCDISFIGGNKNIFHINGDKTYLYDNTSFKIPEGAGETLDEAFNNVPSNLVVIAYKTRSEKDTCKLTFCVENKNSKIGKCQDLSFLTSGVSIPYQTFGNQNFDITSVSCGCKRPNNDGCLDKKCLNIYEELSNSCCAELYFEPQCQDCYYRPKVLYNDDQSLSIRHSAVVKSVNIRPKCILSRKVFWSYQNDPVETDFKNSSRYFPSEHENLVSEQFICTCPEDPKPYPKPDPKHSLWDDVKAIVLPILGTLILIAGLSFIIIYQRKDKALNEETVHELQEYFKELNRSEGTIETTEDLSGANKYHPYNIVWELDRGDVSINLKDPKKLLGLGTFGKVVQGSLRRMVGGAAWNLDVAIKTIHCNDDIVNIDHIKALINEIRVMCFIGEHPNIVRFFGAHTNLRKGQIFCVMELCKRESLLSHVQSFNSKLKINKLPRPKPVFQINPSESGYTRLMTETQECPSNQPNLVEEIISPHLLQDLLRWSLEIASGMLYLSEKNVLHKDLAARNILLSQDNMTAKISDFSISRKLYANLNIAQSNLEENNTGGLNQIPYKHIALESLYENNYSSKSDVWMYGITIWEIFSLGEVPYKEINDPNILYDFLSNGKRLESPKYATPEIYAKLLTCWNSDPNLRPNFMEIKTFFSELIESNSMK